MLTTLHRAMCAYTRRSSQQAMRPGLALALQLLLVVSTAATDSQTSTAPLNVLMFAADDLRPQLNCYAPMTWAGSHATMSTPHIDALASLVVVSLCDLVPVPHTAHPLITLSVCPFPCAGRCVRVPREAHATECANCTDASATHHCVH